MKALPVTAFAVAAVIGWLVAGKPAPAKQPAAVESAAPARDPRPERRERKTRGPDGIAGQRLAAIRASRDPAARMRATVDLASTLSPAEFADWMSGDWFNLSGVELTLFSMIIKQRWIDEDPEGYIVWAQKNSSGSANGMLASWAATDPRRVLEFFKNHPNDSSELRLLGSIAKADPALALQRFLELASSTKGSNLRYDSREVLAVLAEKSPDALEAALDSLPAAARHQAETGLISQRMKKGDFDEEFLKLQDRSDGARIMQSILTGGLDSKIHSRYQDAIFNNLANLPTSWISAIARNPYGFISDYKSEQWITCDLEAYGFSAEQAKNLRSNALNNLYSKPELALKLLPDVEMEGSNRSNFLGNIFRNLNGNAEKAERLIAMLESDADRETARNFAQQQTENGKSKLDNPSDWLASAAKQNPGDGNGIYGMLSAAENWVPGKRDELVRQFRELPDESKLNIARNFAKNGFYTSIPSPLEGDTTRILIENPEPVPENNNNPHNTPERVSIQLASRYVGKLVRTDPTAAGQWVSTLPDGQPKLWAQKNLHTLWSQYDPAAAEEWFGSLPAATRENVKNLKRQ